MVAVNRSEGPIRLTGCAPLYALQPKWTPRLFTQMTLYVLFIGATMAAGGLMPWIMQKYHDWANRNETSQYKLFSKDDGYIYNSNNSYSFCPRNRIIHFEPLQRGYPAAPLDPRDGILTDAWSHKQLKLFGVSWFGFNNKQSSVDGLWAGGSSAATDLQAIVYQLKLLGFNTIRLPFTFDILQQKGKDQVAQCNPGTKSAWARRATDPAVQPQPGFAAVPDPAVYLHVDLPNLCNTYLPGPSSTVLERLLWVVQFLTASGFYVVLDYHPLPDDPIPLNAFEFAQTWLMLWATISCLPNFSSDVRGRILLDLLNEPDKLGNTGIAWNRRGEVPGLEELYLSTMDSIEHVTPGDALFLLQGSAMTDKVNKFGLCPGDGFVTASKTIQAYGLSDPKPFFDTLVSRSYRGRVLLAPHLYGPSNSGTPGAAPEQLLARLNSSFGTLALEGHCNADQLCARFPVVAGEMGSMLDLPEERSYYETVSLLATGAPPLAGINSSSLPLLSGWIWWAYNANSNGTGGLVSSDWQQFLWPKLRFLVDWLGLKPWYHSPEAFIRNEAAMQADALQARGLADAAAAAKAAAAAALAEANDGRNLSNLRAVMMDGPGGAGNRSAAAAAAGMDVTALVETLEALESSLDIQQQVETVPAAPKARPVSPAPSKGGERKSLPPPAAGAAMAAPLRDALGTQQPDEPQDEQPRRASAVADVPATVVDDQPRAAVTAMPAVVVEVVDVPALVEVLADDDT